jgi:hypothetical protein
VTPLNACREDKIRLVIPSLLRFSVPRVLQVVKRPDVLRT